MEHVVPGRPDPRDDLPEGVRPVRDPGSSDPDGADWDGIDRLTDLVALRAGDDRPAVEGSVVDLSGGTSSAGSRLDSLLDLTDTDGREPVVDLTGAGRPVRAEGADGPVAVLHRPESGFTVPRSLTDADSDSEEPSWPRVAGAVLARVVLALGVGLLLWATAPALLGWSAQVVLTESMSPRVNPGDVVLAVDVDPATLRAGQVILFRDPENPGRSLVHRIADVGEDGSLTTRGDHNQSPDAAPVTPDLVEGLARLRVPFAGLPVLWATQGRWFSLLLLVVAALALVRIAAADRDRTASAGAQDADSPNPDSGTPVGSGHARPGPQAGDHVPVVVAPPAPPRLRPAVVFITLGVGVAATGLLLTVVAGGTARAAFRAESPAPGNTWTSAPTFVTADYPAAVLADDPLMFFRLNDSRGTVAINSAPGGQPGNYGNANRWAFGVTPEPLPNNPGTAVQPVNPNACLSTSPQVAAPTTYSVEAWFRANPGADGQLVGFQGAATGTGGNDDRHLYLTPGGALSFGVGRANDMTVASTTAGYADGQWHQVVVTRTPAQTKIYVDGTPVVSGPPGTTWTYNGYWRIGCGNLNGWPGAPVSQPNRGVFGGALANVAIYPTALSDARIQAHFAAR
ncbi:MAG: signal peptidase I [Candidatus Nanopelagicales bacterium]